MRNITPLYHPDDIHQHFLQKWKTELFKEQHQTAGSYINTLLEQAAKYPLFMYDYSFDDENQRKSIEWRHFSPWWRGIGRYSVDDPILQDIHWIHELTHIAHMCHVKDLPLSLFKQKMMHQEVMATIASMFEIYFEYPELRNNSVKFEILADEFLEDKNFLLAWHQNKHLKRQQIYLLIKRLYLESHHEAFCRKQIYIYGLQNAAWQNIWTLRYNLVEERMERFIDAVSSGSNRVDEMDALVWWLASDQISDGTEIPFYKEARSFAVVTELMTPWGL